MRSDDGIAFATLGRLFARDARHVRLFAAENGTLVVAGACPTKACVGGAVLRPSSSSFALLRLSRAPQILAAQIIGDTIYVLGVDNERPVLYRSGDLGTTFRDRVLGPPDVPPSGFVEHHEGAIGADQHGLHFVWFSSVMGRRAWRAEGDALVPIHAPDEALIEGGHRDKMLAVRAGTTYESLDAGRTWGRVPSPAWSGPAVCNEDGCFLGARILRVGWSKAQPSAPASTVSRATALRCTPRGPAVTIAAEFVTRAHGFSFRAFARGKKGGARMITAQKKGAGWRFDTVELIAAPSFPVMIREFADTVIAIENGWYGEPPSESFSRWSPRLTVVEGTTITRGKTEPLPWGEGPTPLAIDRDAILASVSFDRAVLLERSGKVVGERTAPSIITRLESPVFRLDGARWTLLQSGVVVDSALPAGAWTIDATSLWDFGSRATLRFGRDVSFAIVDPRTPTSFLVEEWPDGGAPRMGRRFARAAQLGDDAWRCSDPSWPTVQYRDVEKPRPLIVHANGRREIFAAVRTTLAIGPDGRTCVRELRSDHVSARYAEPSPFKDVIVRPDALDDAVAIADDPRGGLRALPLACVLDASAFPDDDPRMGRFIDVATDSWRSP
jgi:hypothetical protein